jgi:flagellar biogenesis protein FliO
MHFLQATVGVGRTKTLSSPTGLAGWLLNRLSGAGVKRHAAEKQMHLLETLPLGGKRNLMLVRCAGELFLVGGSFEGVESIVRVQSEPSRNVTVKVDGSCS